MARLDRSLRLALATSASLEGLPGSILSAANGDVVRSLLVTSGRDGEGKSTMAVGMAAALARQSNAAVLLVDGNARRPALADWFDVPAEPGFHEWLVDAALDAVIHRTETPGLSVLTAGGRAASIPDLLTAFPLRLKTLLERFAYVVMDGDSILTSAGAAMFAKHVDGIVLVAECERTKWEVIAETRSRLDRMGGRVLGVALNKRKFYIPGVFYGKR